MVAPVARHDSFLLRCWGLRSDRPRIEVEYIQTGERSRFGSLAIAIAWISAQAAQRETVTATPHDRASGE